MFRGENARGVGELEKTKIRFFFRQNYKEILSFLFDKLQLQQQREKVICPCSVDSMSPLFSFIDQIHLEGCPIPYREQGFSTFRSFVGHMVE